MKEAGVTSLLRDVSRAFYLTLRALPPAVRDPIGLAYLLARASDTVADTELIAVDLRLQALARLRERIMGRATGPLDFGALAREQGSAAEQALLRRCDEAIHLFDATEAADRRRIRLVLETIISGQEWDLRHFGAENSAGLRAFETEADLDDYTYRVAGCVGEFWTEMCWAHLFATPAPEAELFRANGVRFGKGLQLVNILRDLPVDLRKGRCYLPSTRLQPAGLAPTALLVPENMAAFRPLYDSYLDAAESHLAAGWDYTNAIPRAQWRLRLACAWPILIGLGTLRKLRAENVLDSTRRVKISRSEVRWLIARSVVLYPWPARWRRQFTLAANPVASRPAFR